MLCIDAKLLQESVQVPSIDKAKEVVSAMKGDGQAKCRPHALGHLCSAPGHMGGGALRLLLQAKSSEEVLNGFSGEREREEGQFW